MNHHQHAIIPSDLQGLEDTAIIEAKSPVVCRENFQRGNSHIAQRRNLFGDLVIEFVKVHVEGIINGGFLGFHSPRVD